MTDPAVVLAVDPPWQHRDKLGARGAASKYSTMSLDELCALPLPPRAERNVLLLWRLASMQPEALRVVDAWGYLPCAELVWNKRRPCSTCCATGRVEVWQFGAERVFVPALAAGPAVRDCLDCDGTGGTRWIGMGSYTRAAHEVCLICRPKNGRAPVRLDMGIPSTFDAPLLSDVDGLLGGDRGCLVHSAKPDAFYSIVERLYPGPRVEMFSRRTRPGWTSTASDQHDRLDDVARVMREVWPAREREERLARARRASR